MKYLFQDSFMQDEIFHANKDSIQNESIEPILDSELEELFESIGGSSFEYGLIRFHNRSTCSIWTKAFSNYYPNIKSKFWCFAFDWLGRQYAIVEKEELIFRFDIVTGEYEKLQTSLAQFLNQLLVEHKEGILDTDKFEKWRNLENARQLGLNECIGNVISLLLGGGRVI